MQDVTTQIIDNNIKIEIDKTPTNKRLLGLWHSIINRCKTTEFYVRNKIKVCDEWEDFKAFEKWALSNGYSDELYLSRINKGGDYEPSNCCWATIQEVKSNHR